MEFFLRRIYAADYQELCRKHDCHPCNYDLHWTGLDDYTKRWVTNPFVRGAVFAELMSKARRTRYAFLALLKRFIYSQKVEVCNKFDFSMTPVKDIKPSLLFFVREEGKRYAFTIADFFNILKQALTFNIEVHSTPKEAVNPYTRHPFRRETIYAFFVKAQASHYFMPFLFYQYIKVDLNLKTFALHNECLLREFAIKATVEAMPNSIMNSEVRNMLNEFKIFNVDAGVYQPIIPNTNLLPVTPFVHFKPWLHVYFVHLYSLSPSLRERSHKKLFQSMIRFVYENPHFGLRKKGVICTEIQVMPHICFP